MTKVYLSKIAVVTPTREKPLDLRIADIRPLWIGEQSLESIDVWWVLLYFLIAAITIPIVIFLGPVAIRNYVLESDYDDATGKTNVIYRILSPVLCSSIFILVIEALFSKFGASAPTQRWLCSFFYWAILGIAKLLAALLERFVIGGYSSLGLAVLDQSNFAFEMEVAVFYVAVQMVVTIAARHRYRVSVLVKYGGSDNSVATAKAACASPKRYYRAAVDTSEKNLFGYERRFGSLLSKRYSQDPLLRTVFFTIMAIEDCNRPETWRFIERIACSLGVAKTTGIMQQRSADPLSDKESVLLAVEYVEKMWDRYLETYAKSARCSMGIHLVIGSGWYEYDYSLLADTLEKTFGSFYGDYCGTRLLDTGMVFHQVRRFEERNHYDLLPKTVMASGMIFSVETGWLSSPSSSWRDAHTIEGVSMPGAVSSDRSRPNHYDLFRAGATSKDVTRCCDALKNQGCYVERVTFSDGVITIVKFACKERPSIESIKDGFVYFE